MISRRRFGFLAAGGLGFGFSCKNNPSGPSPTPSPTPFLPPLGEVRGVPNATALQNLELITRVARRERPGAYVYEIDGSVDLTGRTIDGSGWRYFFQHEQPTSRTDVWTVWKDGSITWYLDELPGRNAWLEDIAPLIKFDSDRVIQIARSAGGLEACALKPGAYGRTIFHIRSGFPICEAGIGGDGYGGGVYIHLQTGGILLNTGVACS